MTTFFRVLPTRLYTPLSSWRRVGVEALLCFFLLSCSSPSVPTSYTDGDEHPTIYPDYIGVTVPVNIAPLHFHIDDDAEATDFVTRLTAGCETWVGGSEDVRLIEEKPDGFGGVIRVWYCNKCGHTWVEKA